MCDTLSSMALLAIQQPVSKRHLAHPRGGKCLVQRWPVRALSTSDFCELGNDAPIAPVEIVGHGPALWPQSRMWRWRQLPLYA